MSGCYAIIILMEHVISLKNLSKSYPFSKSKGLFNAVNNISFSVQKGEIFGILGPNGAGKTTTLEIIECLKPQSSGNVEVLGINNLKNPEEIKKRIGIQLQSSQYLHHLSLTELLKLFQSLYSSPNSDTKKNPSHLLKLVNLEDKANAEFKDLSGGQKQRFTIATSLVNDPQILFLDEPTTGLDPKARRNLWELIKKINLSGITIVLTTHYMEEAEYLCNRVAIMDEGKILEIDEPKKLIDRISTTTQISFLSTNQINENIFKALPEVTKVLNKFPKTIVEISSLDHINKVVDILKTNQINFSGFTVKTASLEDVYLDLTGKEYENE
jgi:ABC-2 type transport system ATP-binding protein